MFAKFSNSWRLIKASAAALNNNKSLLIYPIVAGIASVIVMITFLIPVVATDMVRQLDESSGSTILAVSVSLLFYVVLYSVTFFCNTALVGSAMIMLRGGQPTVMDGFKIAQERLGSIIGYALIAATVGMILRSISERGGIIGRFISGLLGFGWTVATFLVVPILVVEKVEPITAVKRSVELLKRTWGEQLAGSFSMSTVFGLLMVAVIVVGMGIMSVLAGLTNSAALLVIGVVAIFLIIMAIVVYSSALQGIYTAALYEYAADGKTSNYFDDDLIANAFKRKNS
jgi:Family of unknown function (DUF6159)